LPDVSGSSDRELLASVRVETRRFPGLAVVPTDRLRVGDERVARAVA